MLKNGSLFFFVGSSRSVDDFVCIKKLGEMGTFRDCRMMCSGG